MTCTRHNLSIFPRSRYNQCPWHLIVPATTGNSYDDNAKEPAHVSCYRRAIRQSYPRPGAGRKCGQYDSNAGIGRCAGRKFGPRRPADGHGHGRADALAAPSSLQSDKSRMGEPRSFYPQRRPRLDAALRSAPFDRVRSAPAAVEKLSPVGQPDTRPPGVRPRARSRDDDWSAGTGSCRTTSLPLSATAT